MTKKEFNKLGHALTEELPMFVAHGQLLFLSPLEHIVRAVFLDRS